MEESTQNGNTSAADAGIIGDKSRSRKFAELRRLRCRIEGYVKAYSQQLDEALLSRADRL